MFACDAKPRVSPAIEQVPGAPRAAKREWLRVRTTIFRRVAFPSPHSELFLVVGKISPLPNGLTLPFGLSLLHSGTLIPQPSFFFSPVSGGR